MLRAISTELDAPDDLLLVAPAATAASQARATTAVILSVYENLAEVEQNWRAFAGHAGCTVFQTFDWIETWQRHVGLRNDVRPAIVVARDSDGDILFILPLATRPLRFARELVFLGSELCDYNAPLLAPGFAARVPADRFAELWERILSALRKHPRLRYDVIRLEKMPATVGSEPNPLAGLGVALNPSGAYATPLQGSWDEFYAAKRSSATRSRDRGKRKKLAAQGALAFVEPQSEAEILATLDVLVAQKSRSFARMGVSNIFARPGYLDFYRALFTDPKTRPLTHLSRLDCGEQPVAVNLGLTFRDSYYHLQASHDDGELSRFGPGAAHLHDLLRYAIERGFRRYDFTIGDEPYKRDWCDGVIPLYDHLAVASLRGALLFAPMAAKTRLKRVIKQTPALWEMFRRLRSSAARLTQRR